MRKVKEFLRKYWLGCMCVLTVLIFAVVLSVSSFCGEKKSISASAEEVTENETPTTQPRVSSEIYPSENLFDISKMVQQRYLTVENNTITVTDYYAANSGLTLKQVCPKITAGTYTFSVTISSTVPLSNAAASVSLVSSSGVLFQLIRQSKLGYVTNTVILTEEQLNLPVYFYGVGNGVVSWEKFTCNAGETAYPWLPNLDSIYNDGYNDGYESGESAGHKTGYDEGYKNATEELSSLLITKGNGAYATPINNVVGYVGGTDYLQFDTASGSADLTGLPNDPYVALRLEASVDVTSQYTISYKSLQGKCSLCFYLDDVIFNLFTLPETTTPVTINFTLPYGLGKSYVVNELVLVGYKEPLEFDFDENHYTTGGPCVLKGMELYCIFDAKGAYDAGYDVGYSEGSEVSEQEKQEKYEEGKQAGYNQGISEKTNAFSYINAIITAPVDAVLSMFDVDFMGWNLKGLLGLLVCGAIIAIVIKVLL